MKKKRKKKSSRGRKPNRAVLSGIKPEQETLDQIIWRIIWGSPEWAIVALRQSIKNGSQLKDNLFWNRLYTEFERAVLNGDADWFRRQANAIEKGGSPQRAQFNAKVVYLFGHAMWGTLGQPENWRPLTDAERKAFPNLPPRVPIVVTLTPAGKFRDVVSLTPAGKLTNATARDIYNALDVREVKQRDLSQLVLGYKETDEKKKASENKPSLVVENCPFENKERVMDAIHDIEKRLQFKLKKQRRKR
jgi:hypothetical protein